MATQTHGGVVAVDPGDDPRRQRAGPGPRSCWTGCQPTNWCPVASMGSGPLLRKRFTAGETGWAVRMAGWGGDEGLVERHGVVVAGVQPAAPHPRGRITGMRSCSGATVSLAGVVDAAGPLAAVGVPPDGRSPARPSGPCRRVG
jgi:hypothetical protein